MRVLNKLFSTGCLIVVCGLMIFGCKSEFEGENDLNQAPETFMVADTIARSGPDRYTSQVQVQWWGSDVDGFVASYEISLDNQLWSAVTKQDSTFSLVLPVGSDTADFRFYVRAIDNLGQADPTPASLVYPVKNSVPEVSFVISTVTPSRNPVRSFPILKYTWTGSDPDGSDNLDHYELYFNDTTATPYRVEAFVNDITFIGQDFSGSVTDCEVYTGVSTTPLADRMQGMLLNDSNTLYIRAVDKVDAKSSFVRSFPIYTKRPVSDVLLVNANKSNKLTVQNFYGSNLQALGVTTFDTLQATEVVANNYTELSPDFLTQSRVFALFEKIVWFGDDAEFSLSLAQRSTNDFFNQNQGNSDRGRMFMVVGISTTFDEQSSFLDFTPIRQLVKPPGNVVFRVNTGDSLLPTDNTFPALRATGIVNTRPFEIAIANATFDYDSVYVGQIIATSSSGSSPWEGPASVMAKRVVKSSNSANFIIASLPLERFNGNNNIDQFFQKVLIEELDF